jgi:transposase
MDVVTISPARFIGCDVGKNEIVVFDSLTNTVTSLANAPVALAGFAAALDSDVLVICEATGGYEAMLLEALAAAGRPAHRADARKVKSFIRSFGTLGKNDAIDARALARYGEERHRQLLRWQPADKDRIALAGLVLIRQDMVKDRTAWSNRCRAPGARGEIIAPILAALDAQITAVETAIEALLNACRPLRNAVATVRTVKGFGPATAPALIALMPELGTLDRRQIAALAGLAPHPNQSGARDGYRKVRGGRAEIKRLLFIPAMTAARHDPNLKAFHDRLIANGKKPILALVAVMRKMIIIANARLRDANAQQVS